MFAVPVMERMTEHVRKGRFVDKVKYRMAPLLSASVLLETDPLEKQAKPFRRVTTEDMIDIIARGLKDLGIAHQKRGKKTNLIRDSFIALLTLLGGEQVLHLCLCICTAQFSSSLNLSINTLITAVTEESMECLSKHTKDATALRGSYKFKSAEVATIMVAAGFALGVAGRAFLWEYLYVQGRQLATAELIQSKWPEMWTQFCNSVFPGLLDFKATVDSWGTFDLNDHQLDCRDQAYADWHLCACLLTDSCFHYYDYTDSQIWQELDIFSNPTTPFMVWHHDTFAPYVRQLQQDADRAYRSICDQRGGRTVLDQARDNLRIEVASTFDHSRAILAEMIRL